MRYGSSYTYASLSPAADLTLPAADDVYYVFAELTYSGDPTTDLSIQPLPTAVAVGFSTTWPLEVEQGVGNSIPEPTYKRHLLAVVTVTDQAIQSVDVRWVGDIPDLPALVNYLSGYTLACFEGGLYFYDNDVKDDAFTDRYWYGVANYDSGTGAVTLTFRCGASPYGTIVFDKSGSITASGVIDSPAGFAVNGAAGYTGNVTVATPGGGTAVLTYAGGILTGVA
jgi:hypothetical protein